MTEGSDNHNLLSRRSRLAAWGPSPADGGQYRPRAAPAGQKPAWSFLFPRQKPAIRNMIRKDPRIASRNFVTECLMNDVTGGGQAWCVGQYFIDLEPSTV